MKKVNSDQSANNIGVVVQKVIKPPKPDISEFDALIEQARKQAKEAGLKQKDVTLAIKKARRPK